MNTILTKCKSALKGTPLGEYLKNSYLRSAIERSVGDWRYPFLVVGWKIADFLRRRRMVNLDGVKFSLPCQNWITHFRWYLIKKKEVEVREFIDQFVKDGDIFFDVGANIGIFSLYAAKKYNNLKVYSFEPEYSNLALLKENVVKNHVANRVNIYSLGVSDFIGISHLYLQDLEEGAATHTESSEEISKTDEGYDVVGAEGIATVTLDYMVENLGVVPNSIKIDTDGNEVKILNGSKNLLKEEALKSIVIEMPIDDVKNSQCKEILESNGFSLEWAKRGKSHNEVWLRR